LILFRKAGFFQLLKIPSRGKERKVRPEEDPV
jgi:hypothetical protein